MADDSETPYGGEYPDVKDEAASSPKWLPGLGFAILCVLVLFIAIRAGTAHEEATDGAVEGDEATQIDDAPAPEAPGPDEGPQ